MRLAAFTLAAALTIASAGAARAHDETVSTSEVIVDGDLLVWKVDVGVAGLEKVVKLPATGPELDERGLAATKDAIATYLGRGLTVAIDGAEVRPEVGALEPRYEPFVASGQPYISRVSLELRHRAPRPIQAWKARVAFFSDITSQHRAVVGVRWGEHRREYVRLGVAELEVGRDTIAPGPFSVLREFLVWGMEHIFLGFDHICFLLALLLVASGWRELLKIVTSFTVAHSVTLLLAALDVVRVPSRLTEVLIAGSIAYVAAENLWLRATRHRLALTFAFGLVHGLGFATDLRDRLAELGGKVLVPVLSFNLGVELGQVLIVAAVFPVILLLRRSPDVAAGARRRALVVRWGSLPILLLGLGWLLERLAG